MTSPYVDWTALPGRPCSVAAALQLLGERWALLAVREISYGNHRFVDIVRNTGAPRDRLATRLRGLVNAGIVERRQYSERPDRYEYRLTEAGAELRPVAGLGRQVAGRQPAGDLRACLREPDRPGHHVSRVRSGGAPGGRDNARELTGVGPVRARVVRQSRVQEVKPRTVGRLGFEQVDDHEGYAEPHLIEKKNNARTASNVSR
jgi:DNA-binding HxlR family transcriptional regulator